MEKDKQPSTQNVGGWIRNDTPEFVLLVYLCYIDKWHLALEKWT